MFNLIGSAFVSFYKPMRFYMCFLHHTILEQISLQAFRRLLDQKIEFAGEG
jgi:hypothetical protein